MIDHQEPQKTVEPPMQFIGPDGRSVQELPDGARDGEALTSLYRGMVMTRAFDEKAVALQRTGRLGTFAASLGQEAVSVGAASAMRPDDVLLPSFREQGAMLWRGVTPTELFLYWGGDERGSKFSKALHDFPISIPVASHATQAVGVALAMKLRKAPRAALAIMGDGATSKGDFYEAINVAGVWGVPLVMLISNNQWAISVPVNRQTAAETIAQKAVAAGIASARVDGNDVVAVRAAVESALARARSGEGPTLIEAVTYRLCDHTTVDDASRYRSDEEVSEHWRADPLARLRTYLSEEGLWSKPEEEKLLEECRKDIDAAAEEYLATPPLDPELMFAFTFATLPKDLEEQRSLFLGGQGAGNG